MNPDKPTLQRVVISGGGTGGHIFPALAIAEEIRRRNPDAKILFVGAKGRMEEERIPAAGYPLLALPIKGLERKQVWKNLAVGRDLLKSMWIVRKKLQAFDPQVVIGVGGYASAPTLLVAQGMKIPTLIQEQNSYAGVTNKIVGRHAQAICVAYPDMERFFPPQRIHLTGNPVRPQIFGTERKSPEAFRLFELEGGKPTLLVVGGSLGALTINKSISQALPLLAQRSDIQILWQTGKGYFSKATEALQALGNPTHIKALDFIHKMDQAFAIADVVVSRAGASSISELCMLGLPAILVPLPSAAEDHQTSNAMSLLKRNAALLVPDKDAPNKLITEALNLLNDTELQNQLSENIKTLALPSAAEKIVNQIEQIITHNHLS